MVELHRSRAVHLIANEARSLVDEVNTFSKSIFEIDFVAFSDRNSVGDDDHAASIEQSHAGVRGQVAVLGRGRDRLEAP
jgi:hypothetical protein